ncbi:signal peptide peptidase SppA [Haliangium sp.]|uniref:signal peptide peptidase SppA n=1 Tax=Haliangium sp. TaxID=2663208 RepID=UPI003D1237A9
MRTLPPRSRRGRRSAVPAPTVPTVAVLTSAALAVVVLALPALARAQGELRYEHELTDGVPLPAAGLAGEHDALATSTNPAGLRFLGDAEAALAISRDTLPDPVDPDQAAAAGTGLGLFAALPLGGELLPRLTLGLGLELLDPPDATLTPAPGSPTRLTLAGAAAVGEHVGLGLSWHHFYDEPGSPTRALDTVDLGLAARLGARWAAGAVVRDLTAPNARGTATERRYEAELAVRPLATDRLELGLGGRVGERSADVDGWLRVGARLFRGVYLRSVVESRALTAVDLTTPGAAPEEQRELRLTLGMELSFGGVQGGMYGVGARNAGARARFAGAAMTVRVSREQVPSVLGDRRRIERIDLVEKLDQRRLAQALLALRRLGRDPAVAAVFVQLDGAAAGWAAAHELRQALVDVRQAGKRVFAYLVAGDTRDYFIATAADRIYLDPAGGLSLTGFAANTLYYKGVFDKLGVVAEFEKIEEYKSAPEAYTRTDPSEPALRMRNELYDGIYHHLLARIGEARGLDVAAVAALVDAGPYTAQDLTEGPAAALVDVVATPEEISDDVVQAMGVSVPVATRARERPETWSRPAVAVVSIEGDIVAGRSSTIPVLNRTSAGGETIAKAIAQARADDRVAAIVLRIDSPGGSALASELMAREVFKTRGVKPIICSLGDVAASGGYYAAAGCDRILALPTTITGSIGIYTGKFDVSGLLSRLGLSWHSYKRGANADMDSMFRAYSAEERAMVKRRIRYFYGRFLDAVASGRGMSTDAVNEIGRGRVWTGAQAVDIGLVDELGGFLDAVALAKRRAGLGDDDVVELMWLPEADPGLVQRVLAALGRPSANGPEAAALAWPPALRTLVAALPVSLWVEPNAVQARLPFTIVWE